jgi:hypothetical protein
MISQRLFKPHAIQVARQRGELWAGVRAAELPLRARARRARIRLTCVLLEQTTSQRAQLGSVHGVQPRAALRRPAAVARCGREAGVLRRAALCGAAAVGCRGSEPQQQQDSYPRGGHRCPTQSRDGGRLVRLLVGAYSVCTFGQTEEKNRCCPMRHWPWLACVALALWLAPRPSPRSAEDDREIPWMVRGAAVARRGL